MPSFHPATIEDVHEVVSHAVARREALALDDDRARHVGRRAVVLIAHRD